MPKLTESEIRRACKELEESLLEKYRLDMEVEAKQVEQRAVQKRLLLARDEIRSL